MPRTSGPFPVFFPEVVDQQQLLYPIHDKGMGNWLGINVLPAQSFQLSGEKTFTAIEMMMDEVHGFSGDVTVRIETDNAGSPSGILANPNASKILNPALSGIVKITFDVPFILNGDTKYWSVGRGPGQTMGNYWFLYGTGDTDSYLRGSTKAYYMGAWNVVAGQSYFKIYVRK